VQNLAWIFDPVHFEARQFRNEVTIGNGKVALELRVVSKPPRLKVDWVENRCQILHFLIPSVIYGRVVEMSESTKSSLLVQPRINAFDEALLDRLGD